MKAFGFLFLSFMMSTLVSLPLTQKAWGAHCDSHEVSSAAHHHANAAEHFHRLIHNIDGYSHLATDAHRLADAAKHLHRQAHEGAECSHLRRDFRKVSSAFRHLKREYRRSHETHHNRHVEHDWHEVESSYYDLAHNF